MRGRACTARRLQSRRVVLAVAVQLGCAPPASATLRPPFDVRPAVLLPLVFRRFFVRSLSLLPRQGVSSPPSRAPTTDSPPSTSCVSFPRPTQDSSSADAERRGQETLVPTPRPASQALVQPTVRQLCSEAEQPSTAHGVARAKRAKRSDEDAPTDAFASLASRSSSARAPSSTAESRPNQYAPHRNSRIRRSEQDSSPAGAFRVARSRSCEGPRLTRTVQPVARSAPAQWAHLRAPASRRRLTTRVVQSASSACSASAVSP